VLARPLRDLRISVTDHVSSAALLLQREVFGRDFAFLPRGQLLTFEELTQAARVFAGLGVRKVRLTGGEPPLRRDLDKLVAMLAGIDGAGLAPVKVNMVVRRGVNEQSILPMAAHFRGTGHVLRSSSTWTSARSTAGGWRLAAGGWRLAAGGWKRLSRQRTSSR